MKIMSIIQAIYFDRDGNRTGESVESDDDFSEKREQRVITPQVTAGEVYLLEKGSQRRPARRDARFQ